jgi:hypothetical protein
MWFLSQAKRKEKDHKIKDMIEIIKFLKINCKRKLMMDKI